MTYTSNKPNVNPDIALLQRVLGSNGCDGLSSKASDDADFALLRIESRLFELEQALERYMEDAP